MYFTPEFRNGTVISVSLECGDPYADSFTERAGEK